MVSAMETRATFHKRLKEIQEEVVVMGSWAGSALLLSIDALKTRDIDLANQIIAGDNKTHQIRFDIEGRCVR